MKKLVLFTLFIGSTLASESVQSYDTEKLKVREAQLARITIVAQIAQLENQYRDLKLALDKAVVVEQTVIVELGKKLNCVPDPQTLVCPVKPEVVKP